ncbi:PREDICTED: uncharacterized protein LOC109465576 [Branchiostoma belcheri]|uniref:Uncharacterized protein LOC109465576 n=1 Tax=Branchiostoma belcheri TaxID=7741 RepID=A0A6P4YMV1_BRABE|nr:PREDICTED: uncharacterized protein LOC109465576 [Branchiostoma belcheri]
MFGAGKRKIKLPARYAASPAEDDPEWLSTPTDNLAEQLDNEILDVSRRIEQMKVDMGLENRTESTSTPLPTHGDVIGHRSTIPEALAQDPQDGRHQRLSTRAPKPIAPPDGHYPTLREVRAFHKAHNDPSTFTQHFPRQTGGTHVADTIRSSDGRPMQFNLQYVSDEDAHPPAQDHIAASGTLHVHACKFCARHRPGVDAGHPAKFCPYNRDRGRQGNHAAARDTLA